MKLRHLPTKQSACILSSPPYEAISLYIIFTNSNSICCFARIHKYYYSANPFFKLFVPQQEFFVFVYTSCEQNELHRVDANFLACPERYQNKCRSRQKIGIVIYGGGPPYLLGAET